MQNNKLVKEYISNICLWVQYEWQDKGNTSFKTWFGPHQEELSYIVKDKGIDKRIEKHLRKMGLNSLVRYHHNECYPLGLISIILM